MTVRKTAVELDLGQGRSEALKHLRSNPDVPLGDFLRTYPARAREALPEDWLRLPLKHFEITPVTLKPGVGVELKPGGTPAGQLRTDIDGLFEADVAKAKAGPVEYPADVKDGEAVKIAYRHELESVARFLKNGLSVLIVCDKILAEHIYEYVCQQAGRVPVLDDAVPPGGTGAAGQPGGSREALDRALQGNRGGALSRTCRC